MQKVAVEQSVVEAAVAPPEQPAKLTLAVLAGMGHKDLQAKAFELHILATVPKKGNRYLKADLLDAITKHIQKGKSAMEVLLRGQWTCGALAAPRRATPHATPRRTPRHTPRHATPAAWMQRKALPV